MIPVISRQQSLSENPRALSKYPALVIDPYRHSSDDLQQHNP